MSSRRKRTSAVLLLAATAVVSVAACTAKPSAGSTTTPRDSTAMKGFVLNDSQRARLVTFDVKQTSFIPVLEVTGNVAFNGDRSTQVVSQMSGPVSRVFVQPGADVRPGDVLASVASPDFAAAIGDYRKADAAYRNAKRIADRDEQLFANDALARSDLDQARSDLAAAQADLDANTQQLRSLGVDDSTVAAIRDGRQTGVILGAIRAPIKGTVVEKLVSPGQVVEAGATAAFTVADLATMWVFANVFESDLEIAGEGQKAEIYTEAAKKPLHGEIDYVAALVDPNTKATAVRIVARNAPPLLRRDMLVRVRIFGRRARTGILVPEAAVLRDTENLPYVFLIQSDGSYLRRRVNLGSHIGGQYEIRGGLEPGAKIVADGALFVDFAESQ